ncbi:MAG TPA: hypothetical protein VLH40_00730 [Atribacteraceae bacterium]|nr:hypothetical protein [Atribacteraceae bacterium]
MMKNEPVHIVSGDFQNVWLEVVRRLMGTCTIFVDAGFTPNHQTTGGELDPQSTGTGQLHFDSKKRMTG